MKLIAFSLLFFSLASCAPLSVFNTPNDLRNMTATLYLKNGDTLRGRLNIGAGGFSGRAVKIYLDGEKKPMQFPKTSIRAYKLRDDYYVLKRSRNSFSSEKDYSFMKRLTGADSRMHLYENLEKLGSGTKGSFTRYETQYYLQLPNEQAERVWSLGDAKFVPDFDRKMSSLLHDCPSLVQKILRKEPGYFYPKISLVKEKRAEILLNIIEEYNNCGQHGSHP